VNTSFGGLNLCRNSFGTEGLRSMLPFLENSSSFTILSLDGNDNFDTNCFELLVRTLHESSSNLNELYYRHCNLTDISVLQKHNLNLQNLALDGNSIGREGFRTIASLLEQKGSNLNYLDLDNTGIDNEGVELIASSLKHNTTLETLWLEGNDLKEQDFLAILKVLIEMSSIENTYDSNHSLTELNLSALTTSDTMEEMKRHIHSVVELNKTNANSVYGQTYISHAAGKAKVIEYQLNSQTRKDLCRLQGIEYSSTGCLFADNEPTLLPDIIALIGNKRGQSELYTSLLPMAPELLSYIDAKNRKGKEKRKKKRHRSAM